jgi:DNA polymerase-3 subunit beta
LHLLSNLLLKADDQGFSISATDLEIGTSIIIPAKIEAPGSITLPGKQFAEVINSLPKDKVTIQVESNTAKLTSRDNVFEFQTIEAAEFPNLFQEKGEKITSFTGDELREIFSHLIFSVSLDESRPTLTGVNMVQYEDRTDFVATDGFRLSLQSVTGKNILEVGEGLILSSRLIQEVLSLKIVDTVSLYVHQESNQVLFETPEVVLVGRLIEGEYAPYQRVIPKDWKTRVVLNRDEFHQTVKLAAVFARESANVVKLSISSHKLSLTSKSSGVGSGNAQMNVEQTGDDMEISFNVKYLIDFLRNVDGESIILETTGSMDPAVFKPEKENGFLHVIMPVRVTD